MPKILIITGNEDGRNGLSHQLKCQGYEVVTATGGKEGIAAAFTDKPDVVLMDLNMPDLDGWEATRQIKADAAMQTLPILVVNAHPLAGDRERAFEAGCIDYYTEPFDFSKMLAQIESLLKEKSPVLVDKILTTPGLTPVSQP